MSLGPTGLAIGGIADAAKVVSLSGPKAKRLSDLSLHKWDLEFALSCLESTNSVPVDPLVIRQALWRTSIICFIKCFGDSESRFHLRAQSIYKEPLALENFAFFRDLRNKHFVHDENSYLQGVPGLVLNDGSKTHKIEKVVCLSAQGETLGQENYSNLHRLISEAHTWVVDQFDALCEVLTKEFEQVPYDKLASMEPMKYAKPTVEDVSRSRNAP